MTIAVNGVVVARLTPSQLTGRRWVHTGRAGNPRTRYREEQAKAKVKSGRRGDRAA
jgi:hypothetical protein